LFGIGFLHGIYSPSRYVEDARLHHKTGTVEPPI
jgi:hypothetical protein